MSFSEKFASAYKKVLPSPFSIAILLTFLTFIIALLFTKDEQVGYGQHTLNLLQKWEEGLWKEGGGGLYFAFQMMLMLILGHIMALSSAASNFIDKLISPCTTTANTAFIVTLSTILVSLFNWGLGLIFGAILARKVGEKFAKELKPLNYPLIGAAAYSGLMVWHGGLSGSAPIKAADPGNIASLLPSGISAPVDQIDLGLTTFSLMNIVVSLLLIIGLPLLMYRIGKRHKPYANLPQPINENRASATPKVGAEKLDHSSFFAFLFGGIILGYAAYKALFLPEEISLKFLTPNFINFFLLGLGIVLHKSVSKFVSAANDAIKGATGILLQFPLYFGILGLMVGSGLILDISAWFVEVSTEFTFPIYTFLSAGLVNIFVPSGGGQWAVQGPIIISAAHELGVSLPKAIMALAYGDQLTNMIQPFWALPLLGITGLKAKDILPYTLMLFLAGLVIFLIGLVVF